ncbi:hypothetical protein K9L16_00025 [Candidatus Pacearchaeota archaeon]|nr:hypothetical protein [Candidatus Pacearchaeota archaeon]
MCQLCNTKPVYEFTNKRKVCKNCFLKWFRKKFLYTIRKFSLVEKGDIIAYKKDKDFRDVVLGDLLNILSEKGHVQIIEIKNKNSKYFKYSKFAISDSSDEISYRFLQSILFKDILKKKSEFMPKSGKKIRPLYLFLDKEILLYSRLRNLDFKKNIKNKNDIVELINFLEKKHKEIKSSVVSSCLKLF